MRWQSVRTDPNRIYNGFNCDRENQNYSFLLGIILISAVIKSCYVLEDYYSSAHHWILQNCEKFSFIKEKVKTKEKNIIL